MKEMTTFKTALLAVNTGYAVTATAPQSEDCEVVFTAAFPRSGHVFYTCRMYGTVFHGFLDPADTFTLFRVKPRIVMPVGGHWPIVNWVSCSSYEEHKQVHMDLLAQCLDKRAQWCPSRLRKHRA